MIPISPKNNPKKKPAAPFPPLSLMISAHEPATISLKNIKIKHSVSIKTAIVKII